MSSKEIIGESPSIGNLTLQKIKACKTFGGPVKPGSPVLQSSIGPIAFMMFGSNKQKQSWSLGCPVGYITVYIYFNDLSAKIIVQWLQWNKVQY